MGFFKEAEYVDYTLLKKKGLLKVPEAESLNIKNDDGFVDVSSAMKATASSVDNSASSAAAPDLGFLGDMAGVGSTNAVTTATSPDSADLSTLKVKIDDLEYKIDRFIDRLSKIEEKIGSSAD